MGQASMEEQRRLARVHCPDLLAKLEEYEAYFGRYNTRLHRRKVKNIPETEWLRETRRAVAMEVLLDMKEAILDGEG